MHFSAKIKVLSMYSYLRYSIFKIFTKIYWYIIQFCVKAGRHVIKALSQLYEFYFGQYAPFLKSLSEEALSGESINFQQFIFLGKLFTGKVDNSQMCSGEKLGLGQPV